MLEVIVGLLGAVCMSIVGWAFSTHQKVGVLEKSEDDREKRDADLRSFMTVQFDDVKDRLGRIEDRIK